MNHGRTLVILALVVMIATAGCVGLGSNDDSITDPDEEPVEEDAADGEPAAHMEAQAEADVDSETAFSASGTADADRMEHLADRQLIHTGEIELLVEDVPEAATQVREMTTGSGGFVSSASQEVHESHNETWRTETLVVRVPSEMFDESLSSFEELGELREYETETEDVTDRLVDLNARLENLRMERDRLRDLFEDANETRDVLAVQSELSDVQEEIERLKAQKQTLEERVAFSTITVHLTEEEPEPEDEPEDPAWYEHSVTTAFSQSVDGLLLTMRATVVGLAYVAPYVLVVGPVTALAAFWYRRHD